MFFDEAKILVKAGDGGDGIVAFRREKFVPLGGPAGGHGGKGGNVIFKVDPQHNTLIHFKKRSHFKAKKGGRGGGKKMAGAAGADMIVPVPAGTIVRHAETGQLLADLTGPDQQAIIAYGGGGGRGNTAFKSSNNQAPRVAEKGLPGQELWVTLELKLIADVGLIGVPNAGKSTLISVVSAARPKIADYPFTTLQPNLGVVTLNHRDMVMADIPGLIEGAHEGTGLGHQFLRHVERSRLLIHLLNGASENPVAEFEQINQELSLFSQKLAQKPQIVVLNKSDLPQTQNHWAAVQERAEALGWPVFKISAVTQQGVSDLIAKVFQALEEVPREDFFEEEIPIFTLGQDDGYFEVEQLPNNEGWQVTGPRIRELALRTYWDSEQSAMRVHQILKKMGVNKVLLEAGIKPGDTVFLDDVELEWVW